MGVQGLWTLITPVARPIKLETMGNKKLAIDSSIWLYQFQNAMRDREGRGLTNAHILGFLRRISKLLYYGIKPVFVFDGGAPVLKRQTITERKKRKQGGQENLAKTAEKLLAAQLRQAAVVQAQRRVGYKSTGDQITSDTVYFNDTLARDFAEKNQVPRKGKRQTPTLSPSKESPKKAKYVPKDQYQLPPLTTRTPPKETDHRLATEEELNQFINQMKPEDLDINSPHFQALSTEMKYEIIGDLRIKSRQQNHARVEAMKRKNDQDFSQIQIMHLKQRNELTQKLLTVTDMVAKANLTIPVKIAAQRNKEYLLVKAQEGWVLGMVNGEGSSKKTPMRIDLDSGEDVDFEEVADHAGPSIYRHTSTAPAAEDSDEAEFEEVTIPSTTSKKTSEIASNRDHMTEAIRYHYGAQNVARPKSPQSQRSIHTGADLFQRDDDEDEQDQIMLEIAAEISMFESQSNPYIANRASTSSVTETTENRAQHNLGEGTSKSHAINENESSGSHDQLQKSDRAPSGALNTDLELDDDFASFVPSDILPAKNTLQLDPAEEHHSSGRDDHQLSVSEVGLGSSAHPMSLRPTQDPKESTPKQEFDPSTDLELDDDFSTFQTLSQSVPEPIAKKACELAEPMVSKDSSAGPGITDEPSAEFMSAINFDDSIRTTTSLRPPSFCGNLETHENAVDEQAEKSSTLDDTGRVDSPHQNIASNLLRHEDVVEERPSLLSPQASSERTDLPVTRSKVVPSLSSLVPTVINLPETHRSDGVSQANIGKKRSDGVEHMTSDASPIEVNSARRSISVNDRSVTSPPSISMSATQAPSQSSKETTVQAEGASPLPKSPNPLPPIDPISSTVREEEHMSSDEELIPWSRSPTPLPRRAPSARHSETALDNVPSDAEDENVDDALEAEERQLAHDLEHESTEWSNFLSGLQDVEKLDEMRQQADLEVSRLKEQRVKDRRDADDVNVQMSKDVQSMLRLFGLPYVISPMEAEAQCAELMRRGLVDGIITDDSDVFLFGGTRVYKNMFNQNKFVECYLMSDLEKELGLGRDKLIQLAYLLGSDYTEGLAGVGPVTAMEILSEFDDGDETAGGLNGLLKFKQWWKNVQVGNDTEKESGTAFRKKFRKKKDKIWLDDSWPNLAVAEAYHKPAVDTSDQRFTWGLPDLDGIRQFLSDHLNWPSNKTDDVILPLIKRQTQRISGVAHTQGVLDSFFDYSLGDSTTAHAPRIASGFQSQKLQTIVQNWRKKQKEKHGQDPDISIVSGPIPSSVEPGPSRTKAKKKTTATKPRKINKKKTTSPLQQTSSGPNPPKRKRAARAKKVMSAEEPEPQSTKVLVNRVASPERSGSAEPVKRPTRGKRGRRIESSDEDFQINSSSSDE
ncbi:hypothetical protein CROQUDRAFT_659721 [Cronartium quercuum f. sp. fusiforme G11]|uniref:Uncharacterized protein n=1 Tax=Cronartium quercuum f. sp. fusiforme G11 TaxID=708437 RepID=A0A9P6NDD9_9BASI|nr:hypothetical protein CROQUDRAFT_659721 [Cronartium quercuum f. sp. fusiforme G11]